MKERVDGKILQQALDDLVPRFPTLMVTIKRGAFWYYFERLPFKPQVEKETLYSFQPIPLDGKRYLSGWFTAIIVSAVSFPQHHRRHGRLDFSYELACKIL